jgi:signal transduction histidine kinase
MVLLVAVWPGLAAGSPRAAGAIIMLALVVHVALVLIALRPIRDLETVAERVWQGDFGARVEQSAIADHEVLRIGSMFNILLDGLVSDRARMRALAAQVIEVGDKERAVLARELHDSTAQHLAALLLQLSAAVRDCRDPALADRLSEMRDAAEQITEEVRLLSHTVHPRVLDDLGLVAALHKLARESSTGTGIDVDVNADALTMRLSRSVESVLYRVGQEAVRNATRHASPRHIWLTLISDGAKAQLEIRDDGHGFDLRAVEKNGIAGGMGLLSMRERIALVDGSLEIKTAPTGGTTIVAIVPLVAA